MASRMVQATATIVLAAALWIVPSGGSRGQGTLGDRFSHADRSLFATDPAGRDSVRRADAVAARAVAGVRQAPPAGR